MARPGAAPLPPCDIPAEEHVLGACMLSAHAIEAVAEILTEADFYRGSHGRVYQAILDLYADGGAVDALTVSDRLHERGQLEEIGGRKRIQEIATLVPVAGNAAHHARIVREMAILRGLIVAGDAVSRLGWDRSGEADDLIGQAEALVFELSQSRRQRGDFVTSGVAAREAFARLEELASRSGTVGVPTGYTAIDEMTSGLHPGNLIVVAARPSLGKTAYALGIAAHCVLGSTPVPVALFTMEMNRTEVIHRLCASVGLVESDRLMTPSRLESADWQRIADLSARLDRAPLFIEDTGGGASMVEVRSKARRLKLRQPNLSLVIVDYLQLMTNDDGRRFEGRQNEVSQISRALKTLAGELDVPVLALSQLSRDVEKRHDRRPILSDLRESGSIEQDADVVMMLYREDYYFPEDESAAGIAEVNIAKQRNGPTGMRKLAFVKRFSRFGDLAVPGVFGP